MTSVAQLISAKKGIVHTVREETPVLDAVAKMVAEDIGALVVLRDGEPCGIVTERDYLRHVALKPHPPASLVVRDIMSCDLIFVRPDTAVGVCVGLMTRLSMRHLPVLERTNLIGLISIGDIVEHLAVESENGIVELTPSIRGH